MRKLLTFLLLTCCFRSMSQQWVPLKDPVPATVTMLQAGEQMVMIHQLDLKNQIQKWLCLDSNLNIISAKKIICADWEHIVAQSYMAADRSIIRIDQVRYADSLFLILYQFDPYGNLKNRLELDHLPATGKKLEPVGVYTALSADKKKLALVQTFFPEKDNLTASSFIINESLKLVESSQKSYFFDSVVSRTLVPVIDNDGSLFIPVVEKFNSYRLGSFLQLLPLSASAKQQEWSFDRKKLKDPKLLLSDGVLNISALCSLPDEKSEVSGFLHATLKLNENKKPEPTVYLIGNKVKKSLVKKAGTASRNANPLNQLLVFNSFPMFSTNSYGVLISAPIVFHDFKTPNVPNASEDLDKIKTQVAATNALTSTRRSRGQNMNPMTPEQAAVYAATVQRTVGTSKTEPLNADPKGPPKAEAPDPHLIRFLQDSNTSGIDFQLVKIKLTDDPLLGFLTYANNNGYYQLVHYYLPNMKKTQLVSTSIGEDGEPVKKVLLENSQRIVLEGYTSLVFKNKLIAVYQDRYSGQMGLVAVKL